MPKLIDVLNGNYPSTASASNAGITDNKWSDAARTAAIAAIRARHGEAAHLHLAAERLHQFAHEYPSVGATEKAKDASVKAYVASTGTGQDLTTSGQSRLFRSKVAGSGPKDIGHDTVAEDHRTQADHHLALSRGETPEGKAAEEKASKDAAKKSVREMQDYFVSGKDANHWPSTIAKNQETTENLWSAIARAAAIAARKARTLSDVALSSGDKTLAPGTSRAFALKSHQDAREGHDRAKKLFAHAGQQAHEQGEGGQAGRYFKLSAEHGAKSLHHQDQAFQLVHVQNGSTANEGATMPVDTTSDSIASSVSRLKDAHGQVTGDNTTLDRKYLSALDKSEKAHSSETHASAGDAHESAASDREAHGMESDDPHAHFAVADAHTALARAHRLFANSDNEGTGQTEGVTSNKDFSADRRKTLAESGKAMEDGSFPIESTEDLRNAVKAHGRAKDPEAAKRHIVKRARALGKTEELPTGWTGNEGIGGGASSIGVSSMPSSSPEALGPSSSGTTNEDVENCGGKGGKRGPCAGAKVGSKSGDWGQGFHGKMFRHFGEGDQAAHLFDKAARSLSRKHGISHKAAANYLDSEHGSGVASHVLAGHSIHEAVAKIHGGEAHAARYIQAKKYATHNEEDITMPFNRQAAIGYLTTNCDCWKKPGRKEVLNTLDDDALADLQTNALTFNKLVENDRESENITKTKGKTLAEVSKLVQVEGDDDEENEMKGEKGYGIKGKVISTNVEEWLRRTDAPAPVRAVVENALRVEQREKAGYIMRLVENVEDPKEKQRLSLKFDAMALNEVVDLVKLLPPRRDEVVNAATGNPFLPDFSGAGGGTGYRLTENEQADVLDIAEARKKYDPAVLDRKTG